MLTNEFGALAGRIWRRKILVLLLTLLFTAASWYSTKDDVTVYTSRAALTVMSQNRAPEQDAILSQGYAAFFNDEVYQARLRQQADVPDDVAFEATTGLASPLLYVSATSTDPDHVATAAGAMAAALLEEVNAAIQETHRQEVEDLRVEFEQLRATTGRVPDQAVVDLHDRVGQIVADSSNKLQAVQLDSTVESTKPSRTRPLALGFASGLFVSCILAMLLGAVSRRLQSAAETERATGAEVVAQVPSSPEPVADAHLWTILRQDDDARRRSKPIRGPRGRYTKAPTCSVIAVTCPRLRPNGKDIARRLAVAASRSGNTVLLAMDLDTVDDRPGLTDYIAGAVTGTAPILHPVTASFSEIGRGTVSVHPYTALGEQRMSELLEALRRDFDTIVVTAPSTLDAAEGLLACSLADEVVLVVEEGWSRTGDVAQSLHLLGLAVKTPVRLVMMRRKRLFRTRRGRSEDAPESSTMGTTETPADVQLDGHVPAFAVPSLRDTTDGAEVELSQSLRLERERGLERLRRREWAPGRPGTVDALQGRAGDRLPLPRRSTPPAPSAVRKG